MKKQYLPEEIMKMAVGKLRSGYDADLDGDGSVSAADARIAARAEKDPGTVTAREKLDSLLSYAGTGGDAENEKLYTYYRDIYSDGARRAAADVFGLASSNTGGYANSYAASAAGTAYDDYMAGMHTALADANERAYKNAAAFADAAAERGDYGYLEALGADMSAAKRGDAFARAVEEAKYGDYDALEYMGVDTTALRYKDMLALAGQMAEYGDMSGLEALGIDTTGAEEKEKLDKALALAKYGDMTLLSEIAGGPDKIKPKISSTVTNGAQKAYDSGGYTALRSYLDRQIGYGQITGEMRDRIVAALTGG